MRIIMIVALISVGSLLGDVIPNKVKIQNQNVVKMAAEGLSQELPKKVDAFTQLISIKAKEETLFYTFEINASQSDDAIIKKDKSRMQKAVTNGICQFSKRFLKSGINISYIYTSAKSRKKLFQFDVDKTKCDYPPEI